MHVYLATMRRSCQSAAQLCDLPNIAHISSMPHQIHIMLVAPL